jgi:hypothetical protein
MYKDSEIVVRLFEEFLNEWLAFPEIAKDISFPSFLRTSYKPQPIIQLKYYHIQDQFDTKIGLIRNRKYQ